VLLVHELGGGFGGGWASTGHFVILNNKIIQHFHRFPHPLQVT
jgi:hypothetical protein